MPPDFQVTQVSGRGVRPTHRLTASCPLGTQFPRKPCEWQVGWRLLRLVQRGHLSSGLLKQVSAAEG